MNFLLSMVRSGSMGNVERVIDFIAVGIGAGIFEFLHHLGIFLQSAMWQYLCGDIVASEWDDSQMTENVLKYTDIVVVSAPKSIKAQPPRFSGYRHIIGECQWRKIHFGDCDASIVETFMRLRCRLCAREC